MSNAEQVPNPKWAGERKETAILVPRGEPARTNLEMERAVAKQVSDYLLHYSRVKVTEVLVALITRRIAEAFLENGEPQDEVRMEREFLMAYVKVARAQLKGLVV